MCPPREREREKDNENDLRTEPKPYQAKQLDLPAEDSEASDDISRLPFVDPSGIFHPSIRVLLFAASPELIRPSYEGTDRVCPSLSPTTTME